MSAIRFICVRSPRIAVVEEDQALRSGALAPFPPDVTAVPRDGLRAPLRFAKDMDRARVLVVEDDITVRNLLEAVLRTEGYDVAIASTSAEALAEARRRPPDIAIVDVRLGGGPDGLTVARRLREDRERPILIVSAADSGEDLRAGFAAGADFYLTKPFAVDDLIVRVEVLLRRDRKVSSLVRAVGDMEVDEAGHSVTRGGAAIDLTPGE